MNCINCGAEIKSEYNNCPYCGKPIQMVPDYNIYDEDNLNILLESTNDAYPEDKKPEEKQEQENTVPTKPQKKKKQPKKIILVSVLLCIILCGIGFGVKCIVDKKNDNSYEYQMKLGDEALFKENYDKAEDYYLQAISISPNDIKVRLKLAEVYLGKEQKEQAINYLEEVITLDTSENYNAYKKLFDIYQKDGNTDAIIRLKKNVKDAKILKIFADYIVEAPSVNLLGGTYSENLKLSLIADKDVQIFYTLDGKNPIANGTLYTESIELSGSGMHTVKMVSMNNMGVYSDIVSETYVIAYDAPDDPNVSPGGGTFYAPTYVYITVPEGCSAYYTWDRSRPDAQSEKYVSPLLIPEGYNILSVVIINNTTGLSSSVYRDVFEYVTE